MAAIAEAVPECGVLFDIGCDHALISIALLKEGKAGFIIAADINKGPLQAARKNALNAGVTDRMEFVLSDGLSNIKLPFCVTDKKTVMLISGMGGKLMERILKEGLEKTGYADEFVFSPQSMQNDFRRFLGRAGFCIINETLTKDDGKYYFIINCKKGENSCLSEADYELGPFFQNKGDELKKEYLSHKLSLYENLSKNKAITGEQRLENERKLTIYKEAFSRI